MFFLPSLLIGLASLALVHRWAVGAVPALARRPRRFAAALAALLGGEVVTGLAARRWPLQALDLVHTASTVAVMTLEIASLPIGVVVAASWVARRWSLRAETPPGAALAGACPPATSGGVSRRQVVEGVVGLGAISASGAVLGWGTLYGRHEFETREVPVRIAGLPRVLDGYVIVQISDLHVGVHVDDRDLYAGLELVRRARPDLLVVTGDIVDHDARHAPIVGRKLADLRPRDGVMAILGNHEYYAGADKVVAGLRAAGVRPLVNEGLVLRPGDGGGFALLGVDDRWARHHGSSGPDLERAIAAVPPDAPRILLSHQPITVDSWPGRVALQLSGHTHGGQINPGFRPADLFFQYVAGLYSVGGTTLYVNRGFGTVGPPSRVGAPPEVTRIVLVAA